MSIERDRDWKGRLDRLNAGSSWAGMQIKKEKKIEHSKITAGSEIPLSMVKMIMRGLTPDLSVVNVGSGDGKKAMKQAALASEEGLRFFGVDVNEGGINNSSRLASRAGLENAKFISHSVTTHGWVDQVGGEGMAGLVLAEGLLCNLLDTDAEYAVREVVRALTTGGSFVLTDCLHVSDVEARKLLDDDKRWDAEYVKKWHEKWISRYRENTLALGISSDQYTFLVMPPGEEKQAMEYANAEVLRDVLVSNKMERFARHWDRVVLTKMLELSGLILVDWENKIWCSRGGEPILGMVAQFVKKEYPKKTGRLKRN